MKAKPRYIIQILDAETAANPPMALCFLIAFVTYGRLVRQPDGTVAHIFKKPEGLSA